MRASLPLALFTVVAGAWLVLVSKPPAKPAGPAEAASSPAESIRKSTPPGNAPEAILDRAKSLGPEQVSRLEEDLRTAPEDIEKRAVVIAALWHLGGPEAAARRADHLLWLVENAAESEFLDWQPARFEPGDLDPGRYNSLLRAWRNAVSSHPDDPRIGFYAARWVQALDTRLYVEFLQSSLEAQPDFGPSLDALGAWCADHSLRGTGFTAEARRILEHTFNPELQVRAARRFYERFLNTELQGKPDPRLKDAAAECLRRARITAPCLNENLACISRLPEFESRRPRGGLHLPQFQLVLNAGWKQMQRLPVEAFPQLPPAVAGALRRMGCSIPQSFERTPESAPQNVIRGEFYTPGQQSWAALCSLQGTVRLLVFEHAGDESPETLQGSLEIQRMQGIGEGRAGFDWLITTAGAAAIRRYHEAYGGPALPQLDHDGIESHILGKASVILYRHQGKWLGLQGAD